MRQEDRQRPFEVGLRGARHHVSARQSPAQALHERLKRHHTKGKALAVLAAKLGRAVYFMLKRGQIFDPHKFYQD